MNSATNLPVQPSIAGVAVGTLITLADGPTKPVEQIVLGEKVRSGDGEPDTVATVRSATAPASRVKDHT